MRPSLSFIANPNFFRTGARVTSPKTAGGPVEGTSHGLKRSTAFTKVANAIRREDLPQRPPEARREAFMRLVAKRGGDGILFSRRWPEKARWCSAERASLALKASCQGQLKKAATG
jgi:hypothetical protein